MNDLHHSDTNLDICTNDTRQQTCAPVIQRTQESVVRDTRVAEGDTRVAEGNKRVAKAMQTKRPTVRCCIKPVNWRMRRDTTLRGGIKVPGLSLLIFVFLLGQSSPSK
ncbi:hypothetical protein J6590_009250 [Homalodisca vitripennis]|nr:hypothetical protein J6590_009250 [Homalodisca vitripennis]